MEEDKIITASLRYPFNGDYPLTFAFGAESPDEKVKEKFREWGIVGHHGLDFGLPEGTQILATDSGKVIQVGENGDFGLSVTLKHNWGESLYAHLKEVKVWLDQEVNQGEVIGLSGQTGAAFGPHLHFGIKPENPDLGNGYLGFIDPMPYLTARPSASPSPEPEVIEKIVEKEVIKQVPVEVVKEVKVVDEEELDRRLKNKLKAISSLGVAKRREKRKKGLEKIMSLVERKGRVTNEMVERLLKVSDATATSYLAELLREGRLKTEGAKKRPVYTLP